MHYSLIHLDGPWALPRLRKPSAIIAVNAAGQVTWMGPGRVDAARRHGNAPASFPEEHAVCSHRLMCGFSVTSLRGHALRKSFHFGSDPKPPTAVLRGAGGVDARRHCRVDRVRDRRLNVFSEARSERFYTAVGNALVIPSGLRMLMSGGDDLLSAIAQLLPGDGRVGLKLTSFCRLNRHETRHFQCRRYEKYMYTHRSECRRLKHRTHDKRCSRRCAPSTTADFTNGGARAGAGFRENAAGRSGRTN
ncbi:hypothetical protein EVAR_58004_1 [Eumeta japonica]|uniref:Uncharacterized protein n=1 Tax=Eumeta variegata TaxID=151549 RepID=A0A4C1Y8J8_EUMVA|nr:hypothetical protein EVAR_58004_1 [Eumeta japonica]